LYPTFSEKNLCDIAVAGFRCFSLLDVKKYRHLENTLYVKKTE